MLKLAKGKAEREKEHKGAKAGTRFILFFEPCTGRAGAVLTLLPMHTQRISACTGLSVCQLPGQAQMRQPNTLKQTMFLKCECKLGHARTEPEGHGRAAAVLGAKPWPGVAGGGLHTAPHQPPPENLPL